MIEKKTVCQIVDEWLEGKDYFLVEVTVSPDEIGRASCRERVYVLV